MSIWILWEYERTVSKRAFRATTKLLFGSVKSLCVSALLFLVGVGFGLWLVGWQRVSDEIFTMLWLGALPATVCTLVCFGFYRTVIPLELLNEVKHEIDKANKHISILEEQIKPKIVLEYDETDPHSYFDTLNRWKSIEDIIGSDIGPNSDDWRYARLKIRNLSAAVSVHNVQVRLTNIEPLPNELKGKLPMPLRFTHDNTTPYRQSHEIQPNAWEFVDVIKQVWSGKRSKPSFYVVEHSVTGVDASFDVGDYKIRIDAVGTNVICEPAWFYVGFKDRDKTGYNCGCGKAKIDELRHRVGRFVPVLRRESEGS